MLLSAETFKIGDRIRMPAQDITGTIEEMTLRHTTLKLVTNERAIIPNSIMNDSIIINNDIKESITSYPISIQVKIDKDIEVGLIIGRESSGFFGKWLGEYNDGYIEMKDVNFPDAKDKILIPITHNNESPETLLPPRLLQKPNRVRTAA